MEHDYFQDENPRVWDEPGTYADFDAETTNNVTYEWNHTLGDVVSAVSAAGLNVELLHEYDYTMFRQMAHPGEVRVRYLPPARGHAKASRSCIR